MPCTYMITAANRGIGLAFVREILASSPDSIVIATARNPSQSAELSTLVQENQKRLTVVELDVKSDASVKAAAAKIEISHPYGIDYLIQNAGIASEQPNTSQILLSVLDTNAVGTFRVVDAFLPQVKKSTKKTIAGITSIAGSMAMYDGVAQFMKIIGAVNSYAYRVSKVAMNAILLAYAAENKEDGVTVVFLHPGFVDTDMAAYAKANNGVQIMGAPISPTESAQKQLEVLHKLTVADTGSFLSYTGEKLQY